VPLRAVTIEQFPGLDLRQDPGDSRGAIDALNVTIEPGRVRTRYGTSNLITGLNSPTYLASSAGGTHIIVNQSTGPLLAAYTRAGALVASVVPTAGSTNFSGVSIGTASASLFFLVANSNPIRQWNGTAWSAPAGMPANPLHLSLSPTDNRLVVCSSGSKVWFSDPGAPTTFGANNFVTLVPGDGEEIQGAEVFNNQLFVFKRTKFFVFYGNTIDATGNPVFNYRAVHSGTGLALQDRVVAGFDGLYFQGADGIYKTTGGNPVCISRPIDPVFVGGAYAYSTATASSEGHTGSQMAFCDSRLYVAANSGEMLVYDTRNDTWTIWKLGQGGVTFDVATLPGTSGSANTVLFADTISITSLSSSATADPSAAIVSRYRLPFETYGTPREKRIRETIVEGIGTPTVQWSKDWGSLVTGSAVTLGTSPNIGIGRQRLAIRGRAFSLQLGASSGAWSVNRVQVNLGEGMRGPEVTI
jgi:hypothetical protein